MAFALDGNNSYSASSGNSFNIAISTTQPGDVLILVVGAVLSSSPGPSLVTGITDTAALTWTARAQISPTTNQYIQTWYAVAPNALTNNTLTVTLESTTTALQAEIFAVSGVNTSTPFDSNASLPATANKAAAVVSTTATNTFVFGAYKTGGATISPGSGFTQTGPSDWLLVEYQTETAPVTNLAVSYSTSASIVAGIGDALQAASTTSTTDAAISATAPKATASGASVSTTLASASATAPGATASGAAVATTQGAITATAPKATASGSAGSSTTAIANATAAAATASGAASTTTLATASATAPSATASGSAQQSTAAAITAVAPRATASALAYATSLVVISARAPPATASAAAEGSEDQAVISVVAPAAIASGSAVGYSIIQTATYGFLPLRFF